MNTTRPAKSVKVRLLPMCSSLMPMVSWVEAGLGVRERAGVFDSIIVLIAETNKLSEVES